ncbi:BT4734/BF3469 family protein [Bacteroides gallinarum]|uniref:BT4734/BF3469 family protein n=1 Tax=Bacteroides gallinarum TaxID=376806 RepID=UPI0003660B6D|nr:BT4734/BF3469 family protein [Bacteroides gallinarum]
MEADKKTEVTVFKQKPYSEEYITPLTGMKRFRVMEYPPNHVDIDLVLDIIRQEKLKAGIDTMRAFHASDHPKYSELKEKLPICLFAGTFGRFCNDALITPSGLVVIDFDRIPVQELSDVRNMLIKDPYTYAAFLSPSGRGYKVLVRVADNIDNTSHNEYLDALRDYYNSPFWDENCKGISRACFLSSDPDLYLNRNSKVWTVRNPGSLSLPPPSSANPIEPLEFKSGSPGEIDRIINFLEGGFYRYPMTPGRRHDSTFKRARELAEWGLSESIAYANLKEYIAPDFPEAELGREVRKAYEWVDGKGKIGSKYRKL